LDFKLFFSNFQLDIVVMPIIPAAGRLRLENAEFKDILGWTPAQGKIK
jgi:hypothetical protein